MRAFKPIDLKCGYMTDPTGVDDPRPLLSWAFSSDARGAAQSAYRITAAGSEENLKNGIFDLWDSGKVGLAKSSQIQYRGKKLKSGAGCWWNATVWDESDEMSDPSATAYFEAGIMRKEEWKASFVGISPAMDKKPRSTPEQVGVPCALLRKSFTLDKKVVRARSYVTALGIYEFFINGKKVGDEEFAPGWTDYNKRLQYSSYDVTDMLRDGENLFGAILADGWFAGKIASFKRHCYGEYPLGFLMQTKVEFEDGTTRRFVTGKGWQASTGPFLYGDILHGEYYDANLEKSGWNEPGYEAKGWHRAVVLEGQDRNLVARIGPPVKKMLEIRPIAITRFGGARIFDMGQNMVGHVTIRAKGPKGTKIVLRYGEMLNRDGSLYTDNLRSAMATDTYVKKSGADVIYAPRFTFHGFRYCEVTGWAVEPALPDIAGNVVYSALDQDGHFECSNPMVNKLYSNIIWGQRGNFLSIPTDCPQRDERLGWTGDAQIFVRTACMNMDAAAFFIKWMHDVEEGQREDGAYPHIAPYVAVTGVGSAAWGDAGVIVPWTIWRCYGDKDIIRDHYESMRKWVAYLEAGATGYLREAKGYGDWLSVDADTPKDVLATAYFAYSTDLLGRMAAIIGKKTDARRYATLFRNIRRAFTKAYVKRDGRIKGDTQTCYLLAIQMNLVSEKVKTMAAAHLVADILKHGTHITTGFVGISYLLPILTRFGYNDIAYKLLQNDTYPSWGYSIVNGATTIWERWNSYTIENGFADVRMNSFNHYSFGSVGEWMFRFMAGIETDDSHPGYERIVLQPNPGPGIDWVKCSHDSIKGRITANWIRLADGRVEYEFEVPANTSAVLTLPKMTGKDPAATEGAKILESAGSFAKLELAPGRYTFTA